MSAERFSDVELVVVGNELLRGQRRDAHLASVSNRLAAIGMRVEAAHILGDDVAHIARVVKESSSRARVVIVSGGLGPTHDDITRDGVAQGLGLTLEFRQDQWDWIQNVFRSFHVEAGESNRRQAEFPLGAEPMSNEKGTAPGFWVHADGCEVIVMPGPPIELNHMLENTVMPRLRKVFPRAAVFMRTLRTGGVGESSMTPAVQPIFDKYGKYFSVASLPHIGGVDIVLVGRSSGFSEQELNAQAGAMEEELRAYFGDKMYATGTESVESVLGVLLSQRGATMSIAESLTGGLIAKRITDVPGSSEYFLAGVVAYANDAKVSLLGVQPSTLEQHGAVSVAVCREMARGVRERSGADFGLATTGIAGPGGATAEKPAGLTYYGLAWDGGETVKRRVFPGDRSAVRERVALTTLLLFYEHLRAHG